MVKNYTKYQKIPTVLWRPQNLENQTEKNVFQCLFAVNI